MRIAIIGAGSVGRALAQRLSAAKHSIAFGVRDPLAAKHKDAAALGEFMKNDRAVDGAEVVILALPWGEVEKALAALGAALDGKVIADATNPIRADFSGLEFGHDDSAAERIQRLCPKARVVKAFNTTGAANQTDPEYPGGRVTMLLAGDDAAAVEVVRGLAADAGFDALAAGPLTLARQLEQLAWLWIHLAYKAGLGPDFAFRLEKR
jgi:NADPH-dependent F420 reductase